MKTEDFIKKIMDFGALEDRVCSVKERDTINEEAEKLTKDYVNQIVVDELEELKEKIVYYQEQVRCSIALATALEDIDSRVNQLEELYINDFLPKE
tara:strand:+ start:3614 stop:3901 length:288 start_codon:yes stop_codon:yes gene_type:complete